MLQCSSKLFFVTCLQACVWRRGHFIVPSQDCIQVLTYICVLSIFCQVCVIKLAQMFLHECLFNTCSLKQLRVKCSREICLLTSCLYIPYLREHSLVFLAYFLFSKEMLACGIVLCTCLGLAQQHT